MFCSKGRRVEEFVAFRVLADGRSCVLVCGAVTSRSVPGVMLKRNSSLLRSVVSGGKLVAVRGESVPLSYVLRKVDIEEEIL